MPINLSLFMNLKKQHWAKKAKDIYYSMEKMWNKATGKKAIAKSKKDHPSWYKKKKK